MALPERARIQEAVAARRGWAVERLVRLVRHASTLGNEAPAQEETASLFEEVGLATRLEPIDVDAIRALPGFSPVDWDYAGRPNVIGIHDPGGANAGRSLVFNSHVDVVSAEPVKLWTSPPFEPVVYTDGEGEWMRGRGAGDMKAGTVCYAWALAVLRDLGLQPASRVVCQSVIEEECTGNGALAACAAGHLGEACLDPEPFAETILHRQVGVMWFQVRVLGRTTHVLGAGRGVNAIEKSWVIIQALRELEEELNDPARIPAGYAGVDHPINLNVGIINGGDWASTVAGECVTRFRLALFPGERPEDLRAKIEARVRAAAEADPWLRSFPPTVEYVGFQAEGYEFDAASAFGQTLAEAHREWRGRDPEPLTCTATTDCRFFELYYDTPATCYGPLARDIHGVDECVSIDSMERVAEVMVSFLGKWCGTKEMGSR